MLPGVNPSPAGHPPNFSRTGAYSLISTSFAPQKSLLSAGKWITMCFDKTALEIRKSLNQRGGESRYCYTHGTYFVPFEDDLTQDSSVRHQYRINYYQWVSMITIHASCNSWMGSVSVVRKAQNHQLCIHLGTVHSRCASSAVLYSSSSKEVHQIVFG